jgi:hypothetical protein
MKINRIVVLGTVLAAGCIARSASAADETFTDTFGPQTAPFTSVLSFDQFNTSLGTLDSIQIALNGSETATLDVINSTGSSAAFTDAYASTPFTATAPDGVTTSLTATYGPFSGTAASFNNSYPGLTASQSGSVGVPSADFGSYEGLGLGTYNLTVTVDTGIYHGSAAFGVFFGGSATASGSVAVTYDYTPTPSVPDSGASIWLLGGVMFGLVAVSQKLRTCKV